MHADECIDHYHVACSMKDSLSKGSSTIDVKAFLYAILVKGLSWVVYPLPCGTDDRILNLFPDLSSSNSYERKIRARVKTRAGAKTK